MSQHSDARVAYIGLGSNLCDPCEQVRRAFDELAELPLTRLAGRSSLYVTTPVGPVSQPDFINAVARVETQLEPRRLLHALQGIERAHGRVRDGTRWGPRVLDLDLLAYADDEIDEPDLRVPHPELARRAFVLVPLLDVAPPTLEIPGYGTLGALERRCSPAGVTAVVPPPESADRCTERPDLQSSPGPDREQPEDSRCEELPCLNFPTIPSH